jgi:hypothetical protein
MDPSTLWKEASNGSCEPVKKHSIMNPRMPASRTRLPQVVSASRSRPSIAAVGDLRPDSPTTRVSSVTEMEDQAPLAVVIPSGVAPGFCFLDRTVMLYGLSQEWDATDEYSCR